MRKTLLLIVAAAFFWTPAAFAVNEDPAGGGSWQAPSADVQYGTTAWECYTVAGYNNC